MIPEPPRTNARGFSAGKKLISCEILTSGESRRVSALSDALFKLDNSTTRLKGF
jgi:hypothetical protein